MLTPKTPQETQLFKQLLNPSLKEWTAFTAKQKVSEKMDRKCRLLILVSLATMKQSLTFGEIAKECGVKEEQVECLVYDAIRYELLNAKMSGHTVEVVYARPVKFTQEHWTQIKEKLTKVVPVFPENELVGH